MHLYFGFAKAKVELDRNIAHIYVILHRNRFSILSKGTDCEITTRDHGSSNQVAPPKWPLCWHTDSL